MVGRRSRPARVVSRRVNSEYVTGSCFVHYSPCLSVGVWGGGTAELCRVLGVACDTYSLTHPLYLPARGSAPGMRPRPTSAAAQRHCRCPRTSLHSDRRAGAWIAEEGHWSRRPWGKQPSTRHSAAPLRPPSGEGSPLGPRRAALRERVGFWSIGGPRGLLRAGAL